MEHSSEDPSDPRLDWAQRLVYLFNKTPQDRHTLRDTLKEAQERDIIDLDTLDMLEGVLDISQRQVRDIMIPRAQIKTLHTEQPLENVLPFVMESGHSRFPVLEAHKDNVVGILHAKDLLKHIHTHQLEVHLSAPMLRPAIVVPESKRLDALLKEFKDCRNHLAIVIDEYGTVSGLVTIEDILEEIVGEIEDEFDEADTFNFLQSGPQTYTVNAFTPIEDFNQFFETEFSDDVVDTIGGLVMQHMGYVPKAGETMLLDHLEITVKEANERHIDVLTVRNCHENT